MVFCTIEFFIIPSDCNNSLLSNLFEFCHTGDANQVHLDLHANQCEAKPLDSAGCPHSWEESGYPGLSPWQQ